MVARSRRARLKDVHELAMCMPHVTVGHGSRGNPIYQVGGKSFVFFRNPRPDAVDPATGERYPGCFRTAAAHLEPGGCFVIEVRVPELRRLPPGQNVLPWHVSPARWVAYSYDVATRRCTGTTSSSPTAAAA